MLKSIHHWEYLNQVSETFSSFPNIKNNFENLAFQNFLYLIPNEYQIRWELKYSEDDNLSPLLNMKWPWMKAGVTHFLQELILSQSKPCSHARKKPLCDPKRERGKSRLIQSYIFEYLYRLD